MHHHRAGGLKQKNKAHKAGSHATKRAIDRLYQGRIEKGLKSGSSVKGSAGAAVLTNRSARLNHAKQLAEQRRQADLVEKRLAGGFGPPKNVSIVSLSPHGRTESVAAILLSLADDASVSGTNGESLTLASPLALVYNTHRQRLLLSTTPRPGQVRVDFNPDGSESSSAPFVYNVSHSLSSLAAADLVLVHVDMSQGEEGAIDENGDLLLTCLRTQGVPSIVGVVTGCEGRKKADLRRWATRLIQTELGNEVKVVDVACPFQSAPGTADPAPTTPALNPQEQMDSVARDPQAVSLLRHVCSIHPRTITWRSNRSWLTSMHVQWTPEDPNNPSDGPPATESGPLGTLSVTGYLRGKPLNVHQLICLPQGGVYQIASIAKPESPFRVMGKGHNKTHSALESLQKVTGYLQSLQGPVQKAYELAKQHCEGNNTPYLPLLLALSYFATKIRYIEPLLQGLLPPGNNTNTLPTLPGTGTPLTPDTIAVSTPGFRESLEVVAAPPDTLANEQTWPTDEEIRESDEALKKRRPADTSSYQAAWLESDDDDEDGDDSELGEGSAEFMNTEEDDLRFSGALPFDVNDPEYAVKKKELLERRMAQKAAARSRMVNRRRRAKGLSTDEEDDEESDAASSALERERKARAVASQPDSLAQNAPDTHPAQQSFVDDLSCTDDLDEMEDADDDAVATAAALEQLKKRREAALTDNVAFPDEVDTPVDQPARERFARYRGLKSFRSSYWDPRESLPVDYSRVYNIPNFLRTQRRVLNEAALAEKALLSLETAKLQLEKTTRKQKHASAQLRRLEDRMSTRGTDTASVMPSFKEEEAERQAIIQEPDTMDEETGGAVAGAQEMETEVPSMDTDEDMGTGAVSGAASGAENSNSGSERPVSKRKEKALQMAMERMQGRMRKAAEQGAKGGSDDTMDADDAEANAAALNDLSDILGPGWVSSGQYICIHLQRVPQTAFEDILAMQSAGVGITAWSLLRHEYRTTVMHYQLQRWEPYDEPIKAKDALEFHIGPRVFDGRPLFSQQYNNCDKNKLDRFFLPGGWVTASVYAPITFAPMPVLVYKRIPLSGENLVPPKRLLGPGPDFITHQSPADELYPAPDRLRFENATRNYKLQLVATGSVLNASADRVVLKRTILTGYPTKVSKRLASVRFMFFNPADIEWFKPIELYTKGGAIGHIAASIGTHGYMKVRFDRPITQADTVCMPLYKRVFPRWGACYKSVLKDMVSKYDGAYDASEPEK